MKTLLNIFRSAFLITGSVVGAGFVTGRELVGFFYGANLFVGVAVFTVLFFFAACFIMTLGKRYGGNAQLYRTVFEKTNTARYAEFFCLFVSVAAMLSGLDALGETLGLPAFLPLLSVVGLLITNAVCAKGLRGVEKVNLFLVPFIAAVMLCFVCANGKFHFDCGEKKPISALNVLLYACMNVYLTAPVLAESGKGKTQTEIIAAGAFSSVILGLLVLLLSGAIYYRGKTAVNADLPLAFLFTGNTVSICLFAFSVFFGIITSLLCAYYPLYKTVKAKKGGLGISVLCVTAFSLSRLGLKFVVAYAYPIIGALGAVYIAFLGVFALKRSYKEKFRIEKSNNSNSIG